MGKQVEFKVGKEILRGSLFVPKGEGPFPGIVFYHGRGSNRGRYLEISKRLSEKGFIALAFDFRGCGVSNGVFKNQTQRMGIDDARAGLEFLLKQNVDKNRIGIMGTSFGGFVASILMNEFDYIKSLVLRVPAIFPEEIMDINVTDLRVYSYVDRKKWLTSVAYEGISKFKGDLLVIQSENDEVVKDWIVRNYYYQAVNAEKRKIVVQKGAGHDLRENPSALKEFYKLTFNWFLKTL